VVFAVATFAWYIYTSSSTTFNYLLGISDTIRANFVTDFLNPQSRGSQVLQGTGLQSATEMFWHVAGTYVYYATELLIVVGLLSLLVKQKRSFFNDEFNIMFFANMALLVACIVVPNLASAFNMSRFYQVTLFFLAPLCIVGGMDVLRFLSRKRVKEKYILAIMVLGVLIPFFLFQTGFVYEVSREQDLSLPLSSYRLDALTLANQGVIEESEVSGATWLTQFTNLNRSLYADITSAAIFNYVGVQNPVWLSLGAPILNGSYVYLRGYNVLDSIVFTNYGNVGSFNVTQITPSLNETNLIYSSGSCQIYEVPLTP
jgi:uncharacterized membrane protein